MRPRIRTLKPETWQDEKVVALSRDARLLFAALITMADDEGRFRARRTTIVGHVFAADEGADELVDKCIAEIKKQGMIVFYVVDGTPYGAFRNWRRHQKINKPTSSQLPPPPDPKVLRSNRVPRRSNSGSATGELREDSGRSHSSLRGRALRSDPILIRSLCQRLAKAIVSNDPKANPSPESQRWLTDMRLLVEERGGDVAEVERMIDWSQADSFWRSNILSPAKLRKQFTRLVLKASEATGERTNGTATRGSVRRANDWMEV